MAGPGFINIYLARPFVEQQIQDLLVKGRTEGTLKVKKTGEGEKESGGANDQKAKETARVGVDLVCVAIAIGGAVLSTVAEWQRSTYLAANPGKLFTGGLFVHARHINYTGEVLLFMGWAMLTPRLRVCTRQI